jgi:general secretion pathway protein G
MERSGIRISYSRRLSFPPDFAALHPGYSTPARSNSGRGFTLIELMVVVVILGILAAVVVPRVMDRPEQARISATKNNIRAIRSALDMYKLDNHYYPTTDQGLEALVQRPDGQPQPPNWTRYMEKIPFDPWGNNYFYLQPGKYGDVDVFSPGPNGRTGDEDDIGSWQL